MIPNLNCPEQADRLELFACPLNAETRVKIAMEYVLQSLESSPKAMDSHWDKFLALQAKISSL